MTSRIHNHHNANTISHLSQETPLPFKKYTKKRSWVWDWFEQDPDNKYRAVCLYCHQEIFRLDGDRGSPKKLITHVNSKHGISKDNFASTELHKIRMEKLKAYVQVLGPLVTNRSDAIMYGIMNLGIHTMVPKTASLASATSASPPHRNESQLEPIGTIVGETRPQLPVIINSTNEAQSIPTPAPTDITTLPRNDAPIGNVQRIEPKDSQIDVGVIDPSLGTSDYERPLKNIFFSTYHNSEKQEEIDKYNDLILNHNKQVEEYNKVTVIANENKWHADKTSPTPQYVQEEYAHPGPQKLFMPLVSNDGSPEENGYKEALKNLLMENSSSFNNLLFIESESFRAFIDTIRENPNDPI